MAVTDVNGSQTATVTTEHTLADTSAAATYQLTVDTDTMVAGDGLELRLYKMTRTGGTRRVVYFQSYQGAQPTDDKIKISVPVSTALTDSGAIRATLKQTTGTSRAFPWALEKFA